MPVRGGSARFTLRELLNSTPAQVGTSSDESQGTRALARTEYRFPVAGVPPLRLPRDVSALHDTLSGEHGDAALAVLLDPRFQVPLRGEGTRRAVALLSVVRVRDRCGVCVVRLDVQAGKHKHQPPVIVECGVKAEFERDTIIDMIERVWLDADPRILHSSSGGRTAVWLGGDPGRETEDALRRIGAVCAIFGLVVEVVQDAVRHVNQVKTRLGSSPPDVVLVWRPHAYGAESAVAAYRRASADGYVVELNEDSFDDALLELKWKLQELDEVDNRLVAVGSPDTPQPGEDRFYIKVRGSGGGDVMTEVADCGHGQWGSDTRRSAPRADKGLGATVGVRPKALYLCSKCKKHRWRARF